MKGHTLSWNLFNLVAGIVIGAGLMFCFREPVWEAKIQDLRQEIKQRESDVQNRRKILVELEHRIRNWLVEVKKDSLRAEAAVEEMKDLQKRERPMGKGAHKVLLPPPQDFFWEDIGNWQWQEEQRLQKILDEREKRR